jgi:RNA polymerase sigma-70 factor, ECF subfamily
MNHWESEGETERLLLEGTRGGSPEALADLVRLHSSKIYKWSLKILKNHEDAQDNTQNVLCKMYLSINTFKGRSRFSTWLFRVTLNEALLKIRASRSQPARFEVLKPQDEDSSVPDVTDCHADPEQQYLAKELVAKAFLGLHPSVTQLFLRHKAEGWTQRELADKMGISVSALKARIFSAREQMQARLHGLC